MVCIQTIIYICIVIIQFLISTLVLKLPLLPQQLIMPTLITCLITFLCYKKFIITANILIVIAIILAIIVDIYGINNPKMLKTLGKLQVAKESKSPNEIELQQKLHYEIEEKIKNYGK